MGCATLLNVKAGLTWNIALEFGYFPSQQYSIPKFFYIWNYHQGFYTIILIFIVFIQCIKERCFSMILAFCERYVDILNFKHSPYLLFLMTAEFYRILWTCSYVVRRIGECFVSRFYGILKICKILNRKSIKNLWAENIFDSISTIFFCTLK